MLAAGLVFGGALFSQALKEGASSPSSEETPKEKTPIDLRADMIYGDQELLRSMGIDERAQILVGNVAFHHNGAVISCDSAVRYYSINRLDCYNNVIINKDSTYVYGDRAEYNGDINLARVYSSIIKVIDGDATLYTYNFNFNTKDNVGRWWGGGVVYQQDNVMESEVGYFYSDLHEVVGVRGVEMKNDSHQLISDSVRYNTETKVANFYTRTYIWTKEGEMISALKGRYNTQDSTYFFHDNAYVLDEFRETWADTIDFNARFEDAIFYGNIQIDDNEHHSSAFGDLAHYWGERGETRLTRRPSLLNYDAEQGNADTLYMRADTIFMFVTYPSDRAQRDTLDRGVAGGRTDDLAHLRWVDSLSDSVRLILADSLAPVIANLRERIAGLHRHADSIINVLYPPPVIDSIPEPLLEPAPVLADTLQQGGEILPVAATLPAADISPPSGYQVSAVDSISVSQVDSLSAPLLESVPAPISEPEKPEPPEVVELRALAAELIVEADSLQRAESYIRPRAGGVDNFHRPHGRHLENVERHLRRSTVGCS